MEQRAPLPQDELVRLCPTPEAGPTAAGWIGGLPSLPAGAAWPRSEGRRALFLAQINLAALPAGLWRGCGARDGWLRVFLDATGRPRLIRSALEGMPEAGETAIPRWPLARATAPRRAPADRAETPFDLADPACRPVDAGTARGLIAALTNELDRAESFLDAVVTQTRTAPQERPGGNGIWGRILRAQPRDTPQAMVLANPGILISGRAEIAKARAVLTRLATALERAGETLSHAAIALLCDSLRHVSLPFFLTEPAPDQRRDTGGADPVRIYQRNVPATRSARAPAGTPGSGWAETWRRSLATRALDLAARDPDSLPRHACDTWLRRMQRETEAATCHLGEVRNTADGPVAVLMRLPATPLTGWDWGGAALEICLPLDALDRGDFGRAFTLWPETPDQAQ